MGLAETVIPPLRSDITLTEAEGRLPFAAVDRAMGQRVRLDQRGMMIASVLDRPWALGELLLTFESHGVNVSPELIIRFVRFLDAHLLLDTDRARTRIAALESASAVEETAISFLPDTQHNCVACGASCGGHDVGPVAPERVAAIQAAMPKAKFLIRRTSSEATSGHYTCMSADSCTLLQADRLCSVHATLGVDAKPTDCRVFPLAFARTPLGVVSGVRLECRQYIASKRNGGALRDRGAELAELFHRLPEVNEVPTLVRLDGGLTWPYANYHAVEPAVLSAIASPAHWVGLLALNTRVRQMVDEVRTADRDGQVFPDDPSGDEPPAPDSVLDALVRGCQQASRMNAAAGNPKRAERLDRIAAAAERLRQGALPCPPLGPDDDELLRDHLRQTIYLKDPLTGPHMRYGMGLLNLGVLLASAATELPGEFNGALADALKVLRTGPVAGALLENDDAVADWFHDRLDHWVELA